MRVLVAWIAALGLALLAGGSAWAQPVVIQSGPVLAMNPYVQVELKITPEQGKKAAVFYKTYDQKVQELMRITGDDFPKLQVELHRLYAAGMKELASILTADQMKRLRQVYWQQGGANALAYDEDLQAELNVTPDQADRLRKLNGEYQAKLQQAARTAPRSSDALRKDYAEKAAAFLTADQQKAFKGLLGQPLEVFWGGRGGRGGE